MNDPFSVAKKHILITGGTRGIGRAISMQLARSGAHVLANYVRDKKSADALMAEAQSEKLSIETIRADVTSAKGLAHLTEFLDKNVPHLSGFIHCAATGVHHPVEQLTMRHFDFTYAVNVRAFFELVTLLLPRFSKGATIVAISTVGAVRAVEQYTLTGSSKGALESLARHFAAELAPRGIRVNILSPGAILTDAWKVLPDSKKRLQHSAEQSPLSRLTMLEEVANSAQFLCSDASSGIIGHTLVVDNGCRIVE